MDFITAVMSAFWRFTEKKDQKRIASQTPPPGVCTIEDIPYRSGGNKGHLLDVYYPEASTAPFPVLIDIHGGGWMYGYKEINKYYNMTFASHGFCVFSINYRLAPEVTVREQLRDIMDAFSFIEQNLHAYPCDTKNIFLTGDSAGGQLAAYATILNQSAKLQSVFTTHGSGLDFRAVLLTSPVAFIDEPKSAIRFGLTPVRGPDQKYSPIKNYFNIDAALQGETFPPCMLVTSSGDFIAREQTRKFYKLLCEAGCTATLLDMEKYAGKHLPHVFAVTHPFSAAGQECIAASVDFLKKHQQ